MLNSRPQLRIGFVALTDCAPLAMAQELGLFRKFGLRVSLQRQLGWATIRDKVVYGELDAAQALAAIPLAATLGHGSIACECLSALILNLHGNAITLSNELRRQGVRDGDTLREAIAQRRGATPFTFGVVFPFSSHRHLLRKWLGRHRIDPDREVRVVVVPPAQMTAQMKSGHLDGFCVGEPWNSVAVLSRAGWCAATSAELDPGHPEKVLMVRRQFAEERGEEHVALLAALLEACEFCDEPANRDQLIRTLARPEYVNASPAALRHGLEGKLHASDAAQPGVSEFFTFSRHGANEPSADKVAWVLDLLRSSGLCKERTSLNTALGRRVFRPDIYEQAAQLRSPKPTLPGYGSDVENQLLFA